MKKKIIPQWEKEAQGYLIKVLQATLGGQHDSAFDIFKSFIRKIREEAIKEVLEEIEERLPKEKKIKMKGTGREESDIQFVNGYNQHRKEVKEFLKRNK